MTTRAKVAILALGGTGMTEGIATPGAGWRRADGWVGKEGGRRRRSGRRAAGEVAMVDDAEFTSYYGRPIIKAPVWKTPDVPLYLFLGGAAGTSAILGALGDVSGRPALARVGRFGAGGGSIRCSSWCTIWGGRSGSCTCCG